MSMLSKDFYERDPALVAQDLLGKILVRKINSEILSGKSLKLRPIMGKMTLLPKHIRAGKCLTS